jgi:GH24 family phage-related lysozyme (muramidase)
MVALVEQSLKNSGNSDLSNFTAPTDQAAILAALQAGNCTAFGTEMGKGYTNTITAGGYNTNILGTFEETERNALKALYQLPDAIKAILARIRQGNIDKKESVSISDIIHNYEIAFSMGKKKNGVMEYYQPLVLSDGITTVSDIHLVFSDNIVKVRPVPLPPPIDISLKDRTEIGNLLIYGLQLSSANYISIGNPKDTEFKDLKAYLGGNSGYIPPIGEVDIDQLQVSQEGKSLISKEEGGCILHIYNDYKGAKSDYCKEHYEDGQIISGHKTDASWNRNPCDATPHYGEIKSYNIKGYGNPTISVGYMITNEAELSSFCLVNGGYISKDKCLDLFSKKLPLYIEDLKKALPSNAKLTQCQFDALVSIVYNRGIGKENCSKGVGKCGFKSDELYKNYLKNGNFSGKNETEREEIKNFIINDHSKLKGGKRREAEANLYFNCKY